MTTEYELIHHGILGMKWGVRRYQPYGEGGYNPKHKGVNKVSSHEQRYKARKAKVRSERAQASKDRSIISDQSIDQKIKRLQKEKQLKDLTEEALHPGRTMVKKASKTVLDTIVGGAAAYGGYLLLQKALGTKIKWKGVPVTKLKKVGKKDIALIEGITKKKFAGIEIGKATLDPPQEIAKKFMGGAKAFVKK